MTESADVIVIGAGGAGLAAAAEVARLGRKAIVLEKNPAPGGTTALAVGSIMAAGTRMQKRAGVEDSPAQHDAEMGELAARLGIDDSAELRRVFTENAAETVDFLESIGVDFLGPLEQPPFRVPRFHVALPGGRAYVRRLARFCARSGVSLRTGTPARRLIVEDGRVCGVATDRAEYRAGSVLLASGDFSANPQLRAELLPPGTEGVPCLNPSATGDGQKMAREIGARLHLRADLGPAHLVHARFAAPAKPALVSRLPPTRPVTLAMKLAMQHLPRSVLRPLVMAAAMTALSPERAFFERGAILVNRRGERFTDELQPAGPAIARQAGAEAFVVFDERIARHFSRWPNYISTAPGIAYAYVDDYRRARPDIFRQASTLAGLAAELRLPLERLAATLAERGLNQPPYYAMGPIKPWLLLTPVGTAVNGKLQVLRDDGTPIDGLYAAGGAGQGGFTTTAHGHGLGWAMTSGRVAARHAAQAR